MATLRNKEIAQTDEYQPTQQKCKVLATTENLIILKQKHSRIKFNQYLNLNYINLKWILTGMYTVDV